MKRALAAIFTAAAAGQDPAADGTVDLVGRPGASSGAVVAAVIAFTAHNVIAADVSRAEVEAQLDLADPGAPMSAPFLTWLGRRVNADPGVLDCVLVRHGTGGCAPSSDGIALVPRPDLAAHPRAAGALCLRAGVAIYADPDACGLVILGRGLAGRREISFEVAPEHRGAGLGRRLVAATLALLPAAEPMFAQASPGNAASLRGLLACGFCPIGSEVLFVRRALPDDAGAGRVPPAR